MESRVNYLISGIFVILFAAGLLGFAFWLMKYGSQEEYNVYKTYFKESVTGLSKESVVKYMGVDIGLVENVEVDPKNSDQIKIILQIKNNMQIKEDMRVTLKFYGMTGLAYLEIKGKDHNSPLLKAKEGEMPTIKSVPSLYARADESLSQIASQISNSLARIETLLNEKNLASIENSLANIEEVTKSFKENKDDIVHLVKGGAAMEKKAAEAIEEIKSTFNKLDVIMADLSKTLKDELKGALKELQGTFKSIKNMVGNLDKTVKRGDYNINNLIEPIINQMNELVVEIEELSSQVQDTMQSIEKNPSDLLFKSSEPQLGPGEKK